MTDDPQRRYIQLRLSVPELRLAHTNIAHAADRARGDWASRDASSVAEVAGPISAAFGVASACLERV